MKNNQGFAGIGAIIAIFIALIIGGGVVYYATKTSTTPPQQQANSCLPSSPASIAIISPNGGELYHAGQTITVKWTSCNLPANDLVNINLMRSDSSSPSHFAHVVTTPDASNQFPIGNGSAQITITATGVWPTTVQYGNIYKVLLDVFKPSSRDTGKLDAQVWSANWFTINK
jgi:hypothetical protein